METISPVNRGVNGITILYPGTWKRGSHEKEDIGSVDMCFTPWLERSQSSLSEPEAPATWNVGIPTVGSGGERRREV